MENPKISLIIPAHNEESNIATALDHAIKSSGGKFAEIIVVNNASSDNTETIANSFPGVRVVNEARKGLTVARERGRTEARGDLLAYIDADTRMPLGWYQKVFTEFHNNPGLVCLSGPYAYFDISATERFLTRLYWYVLAIPLYTLVGYMVVGGNFIIRKDVLEKMGGFDTNIAFYGEDTDIARRAQKFGKVKFTLGLPMPTSGRRLNREGFFTTGITYMTNFASQVLFHRPTTKKYTDIR